MHDFVEHVELEGGLAVTRWADDAPVIGMQVDLFNWRLRRAREAKGWTRGELARQCGVSATTVGDAEKLRRVSADARWKIALVLGVPEDVLFPDEVDALPAGGPKTIEMSATREDVRSVEADDPHDDMLASAEHRALVGLVDGTLDTLPPRLRRVIELRFGLVDGQERTLDEVGREFGTSRERIRQFESKALRLLRHPTRSRPLRPFLDSEWEPSTRPTRRKPHPKDCQYRQDHADEKPCGDVFALPGWMHRRPPAELRKPSFWCDVCWDNYLTARAHQGFEAYLAT
jgi:RNA polymerase sigma factor (sigma-70 family)